MRKFSESVVVLSALVAVIGATLFSTAPARAATFTGIHNYAASGQCLDMTLGSTSNGARAQVYRCNGDEQQFWAEIPLSDGSGFLIQNKNSGKCLSILNNSNSSGASVIQWTCVTSGTDRYEVWVQEYDPAMDPNLWQWVNRGDDLLAMVPSHCNTTSGTPILMTTVNSCTNAGLWYNG